MPNHPTAPVFESVVGPVPTNCESLKLKYGIVARKHRKGSGNKRKESHHILQDKAMTGLVSKYSGFAVLLNGGSGGEHDVINALQTKRNCPGPGPKTFGDLLQASKDDLAEGLEGKVNDGNTMSRAEAEKVAACLVAEAEEETQKARKDKDRKPLTKDSRVKQVKGCLPMGTPVWLNDSVRLPVEALVEGLRVASQQGEQSIVRVQHCAGRLVELCVGGQLIALAAHHRVCVAGAAPMRADMLRPGHLVHTAAGLISIDAVCHEPEVQPLIGIGFAQPGACRIGALGLWIEVPGSTVRVIAHRDVANA